MTKTHDFRRGIEHLGTSRYKPSPEAVILSALRESRRPMTYEEAYAVTGLPTARIKEAHLNLILTKELEVATEGQAPWKPLLKLPGHRECSVCGQYVRHEDDDYVCLDCRDCALELRRRA